MLQRTLCIIKPDAVGRDLTGSILALIQQNGLKIIAMKMLRLSPEEARGFYVVHRERHFFESLVASMSAGPIVSVVLEGDEAIVRYRTLMGATNPANAADGTIRKRYALNVEANSVHGSDAIETAFFEISYFFNALEMAG